MIAAGFPSQAAFVAAVASAWNDQMFGGSPGTWSRRSDAVVEICPVLADHR